MPENRFRDATKVERITEMHNIDKIAKKFLVSPYACLVRLWNLNIINQKQYSDFKRQMKENYEEQQRRMKESS